MKAKEKNTFQFCCHVARVLIPALKTLPCCLVPMLRDLGLYCCIQFLYLPCYCNHFETLFPSFFFKK